MGELLGDARFALETAHEFRAVRIVHQVAADRGLLLEGLDHHQLVVRRARQPHRAHAAIRQMGERDVGAEHGLLGLGDEGDQLIGEMGAQAIAGHQPAAQVIEVGDAALLGVFAQALAGPLSEQAALARHLDQRFDDDTAFHRLPPTNAVTSPGRCEHALFRASGQAQSRLRNACSA